MSGGGELDAAGVTDPALRAAYRACRELNAQHGRTYYLSTLLLPAAKRPYVHALYGFARYADDIVDSFDAGLAGADRAAMFDAWCARFWSRQALQPDGTPDPVLPAVWHTIDRWALPDGDFADFLASMRMDLTVTRYQTYQELAGYVHGSAAVIGQLVVPVLGPARGLAAVARDYARDLGVAFQLTNFLRDVAEDWRRGRVYLPMEDLHSFGVAPEQFGTGVTDGPVRRLLAFEIARTRELYRAAAPGVRLLDPASRDCIRTALALYGGILDQIEAADYRVLERRVSVPLPRRLAVAVPGLARAAAARARPTPPAWR